MSPDLPVLKFYRLWIQEHDKMDMKGSMQMFLYFTKIKYTRSLYFHESDHTFFFWTFLQDQENLLSPKNLWHSLCSNWDAKMNIKICKNLFKIPRHNKRSVLSRHLLYPYLFKFLGPQSSSSLQQLYKLLWFRWFITTNPVFSWSQGKKKKKTLLGSPCCECIARTNRIEASRLPFNAKMPLASKTTLKHRDYMGFHTRSVKGHQECFKRKEQWMNQASSQVPLLPRV